MNLEHVMRVSRVVVNMPMVMEKAARDRCLTCVRVDWEAAVK